MPACDKWYQRQVMFPLASDTSGIKASYGQSSPWMWRCSRQVSKDVNVVRGSPGSASDDDGQLLSSWQLLGVGEWIIDVVCSLIVRL